MADKKRRSKATWASVGTSAESGSSHPDTTAPTDTSGGEVTRGDVRSDSGSGESAEVIDTTPTTAEEAMDNAGVEDGFVDESAYAPTER